MTKDEALDLALEAFVRAERDGYWSRDTAIAVEAIKQARSAPVQEPVALRPEDVTVEVLMVQSGGGFAPLKTHGVKLTHKPTGIVVQCSSERSQHRNREQALRDLERYLHGARPQPTPPAAQPAPVQEPSISVQWLAEMIISDCGCSTNNERLLERITARIEQHIRANTPPAQQAPVQKAMPENWFAGMPEEYRKEAWRVATPPAAQRQWQSLTDEEIFSVLGNLQRKYNGPPTEDSRVVFAFAIEAKLKEKNT